MRTNPIFIPWSGGWDSTALIVDSIRKGREVHAHHVYLYRDHFFHSRVPLEAAAVQQMAPLIRNIGPFEFTTSSLAVGGVGFQTVLIAPVICQVIENYQRRLGASPQQRDCWPEYALPFQSTEYACWDEKQADRIMDIVNGWFFSLPVRTPYVSVPMVNWPKDKVISVVPKELHKFVTTCQFPYPDGSPCNKCISCQRELAGKKKLNITTTSP